MADDDGERSGAELEHHDSDLEQQTLDDLDVPEPGEVLGGRPPKLPDVGLPAPPPRPPGVPIPYPNLADP